ncbi:MAG: DUF115 domain-containing protein [Treponema sp.]|jgi:hypothetical protein|nr:DUF115 domain-containing protein [Treponema sp.]
MKASACWEKNLRIIREQYPGLAEQLAASPESGELKLERAASGDPTLIIRGLHIHSPRDPVREGRRLAASLPEPSPEPPPLIVLGFGLGYAAEAAAEKTPDRPFIIVERRPGVLRRALEVRDLEAFLAGHKLIFILGKEPDPEAENNADPAGGAIPDRSGAEDSAGAAVTGALGLFEYSAPPDLLKNRVLIGLDEDWYAGVERHIKVWSSRDDVNMATLRRFGRRWVRNLAANLEAIRDLPGITGLAGVLEGRCPALLAAAGPSLDETGPFLPALRERCLIVAVDTSLRFLLRAGVEPDFTVAVDPQFWNARHLDRVPAPGCCLIAESAVYPPVLRGYHRGRRTGPAFKRALLCSSLFPLGRFIEDRLDPKGILGAGGSVATTAWDFARLLGPASIWIAALDLAFPEGKTHFSGAFFENRSLAEADRFRPAETRAAGALRGGLPFRAPAAGGGTVLTDRRLSLYSAWFENRFREYPETPVFSLSVRGLAVAGLKTASVEELLALPPCRDRIDRLLESAFVRIEAAFYSPGETERREARYQAALGELLDGLNLIRDLAKEAAGAAERGLGQIPPGKDGTGDPVLGKLLKRLDQVNKTIAESEVKDAAGFLFPPLQELEGKLKTPPSEPLRRYLELSAALYRSLGEAAEYNLNALRSAPGMDAAGRRGSRG